MGPTSLLSILYIVFVIGKQQPSFIYVLFVGGSHDTMAELSHDRDCVAHKTDYHLATDMKSLSTIGIAVLSGLWLFSCSREPG